VLVIIQLIEQGLYPKRDLSPINYSLLVNKAIKVLLISYCWFGFSKKAKKKPQL
jgi:hypothetical protein